MGDSWGSGNSHGHWLRCAQRLYRGAGSAAVGRGREASARPPRLEGEVEEKVAAFRTTISEVRGELQAKHSEIVGCLDKAEAESAKINASALPLIGFGVLLSSAATDLARLPLWLNVVLLVIVLLGSIRVLVPLLRRHVGH